MESSISPLEEARRLVSRVVAKAEVPLGAEREVEMAKRYVLGETLDEIGKDYDLTRERVRQLINQSGWKTGELRRARKIVQAEELKQKQEHDRTRVLNWSYANPASNRLEAAEQLDLSLEEVSKLLGKRRNLHLSGEPRKNRQNWSDDDLVALLQEFHRETGSTVSVEFEKWSMAKGGPSRQTPTNRFGTWSAALAKAKVDGSYSVDRERRHTDEDLWGAVVEFFNFDRDNYSYDAFAEWLSEQEGMPSAALIRVRLGRSWTELSSTGQKVASGHVSGYDPAWVESVREQRKWTDLVPTAVDPVSVLQNALAEIGPVITISSFNAWAQGRDAPSAQTLMKRAGATWVQLVEQAGGMTGTRGARGNVSDRKLLEGLVEYVSQHQIVRYEEYSRWARSRQLPVASTLTRRFGDWETCVEVARTELEVRLGD